MDNLFYVSFASRGDHLRDRRHQPELVLATAA